MFGAIAGGIASALAGGAMSKLFGGGQKAASGGIQGDVLATDNNTVGMGDAGIKSAIQGSNVPNPDEAVPSFVSGAMAKAGKGLLEGTLEILHLGNLFLIVQLHFSKLFLILKSGVNHTSRGSISTSTLPSIKLRKCSSKIITSILSFISGRLATKSNQIKQLIRNGRSASLQRTFK